MLFPYRMRQFAPQVLVLLSAMMVVAVYVQALDFPFISDDEVYVANNAKLAGLHLAELWRLLTEPYNSMSEFLPLRELSYWVDITLFGLNPSVFRMHSILLYVLCLPFIYGITAWAWRYFRPDDAANAPWASAAVTALFALHPSHVEAVVWIAGRKDVLSGMFSLLALWLAVRLKREHGFVLRTVAATLVALLAAMLSKATAVAMSPVIAMLWLYFWSDMPELRKNRSMLLWPLAPLFLAICVTFIFATIVTTRIPFYWGSESAVRSFGVLGWLARLSVSAESRHFIYPIFEDPYLPAMVTLGVLVLAGSCAGAVLLLRKKSLEAFSLVVFLLFCLPSLQLIPYTPPSLVSDRFVFLAVWPAIMLAVAMAWRLSYLPRVAVLILVALLWFFQSVERMGDWRSADSLMDADLRVYPGSYMSTLYKINNQGIESVETYNQIYKMAATINDPVARHIVTKVIRADHAVYIGATSTGDPSEAVSHLVDAGQDLKQPPTEAQWDTPKFRLWEILRGTHTNLWNYLAEQFPRDEWVRYNAGMWMLSALKYDNAVPHLRVAIESGRLPESVRGEALKNLGLALMKSGSITEAEVPLFAALEQSPPDLRAYCVLAEMYKQTDRIRDAERAETVCRRVSGEYVAR